VGDIRSASNFSKNRRYDRARPERKFEFAVTRRANGRESATAICSTVTIHRTPSRQSSEMAAGRTYFCDVSAVKVRRACAKLLPPPVYTQRTEHALRVTVSTNNRSSPTPAANYSAGAGVAAVRGRPSPPGDASISSLIVVFGSFVSIRSRTRSPSRRRRRSFV